MTPDDQERLDAVTHALARMVQRQKGIEQRLARLESALNLGWAAELTEVAPPQPSPQPEPSPPRPHIPAAPPATDGRRLETAVGLTWLSRIGVLTVVLALAFFFEYAFENHWITEWGRILLGVACGAGSLAIGEWLSRNAQRTFAQALTGAGIAFLYLSFWAAFALYQLIPQAAAFGLMLLTTGIAGALALRYEGPAIALLGLAGGYATPLLLGGDRNPWFVLSYTLLLNLGAAVVVRARAWRWVEGLAVVGTVVLYAGQMQFPAPPDERWVYTAFVCLYYAQFAVAPLQPVFLASQILAGPALVQVWAPGSSVLLLLMGIALAGLVIADWRGWPLAVAASFAGFWLAYGQWRWLGTQIPPFAATLVALTAGLALYFGWPLWRAGYRHQKLRLQDLLLLPLEAAFYFGSAYALLEPSHRAYEGLLAVGLAALAAALARRLWQLDTRAGMLASGIAGALLVLAAPIQLAGYHVTIAWALEAAAISWLGARLGKPPALYAAGVVFFLMFLRLALVDSRMYTSPASYSTFLNGRFLVFLTCAGGLLAVAWWTQKQPPFALPAYAGGHGILLWGLGLEVAGWVERTAAPTNLRSAASISISVLIAAYAVVLVAVGVFHRHALTRVLGVVLIGIVVLKLYLYDVWLVSQFYRMTAFAILGVLLLLMSYFYSRFRGSMESWWRP